MEVPPLQRGGDGGGVDEFLSEQQLEKARNFPIRSAPTRPIICGKPILGSIVPSISLLTFKRWKEFGLCFKNAHLNVSSTSNLVPKFHVIIAVYVCQIKIKRRTAKKSKH
ncbi:hypothetical protein C2S52_023270 [Perilla frutescens var. hirtella]|nr:hypothetical protein C2S52_023270 [Perilla frutescens var. hirtella]